MAETALIERVKAGRPYYSRRRACTKAVVDISTSIREAIDASDDALITFFRFKGCDILTGISFDIDTFGVSSVTVSVFYREVGSNTVISAANTLATFTQGNDTARSNDYVPQPNLALDKDKEYELILSFGANTVASTTRNGVIYLDFLID